jgi:hypothetical protein
LSRIAIRVVERLLNSKKRRLRNSGVSKQKSHNLFVTFPHIILEYIQMFSNNAGEFWRAIVEAFIMQRKGEWKREQALSTVAGGRRG